MSSLWQLTGSKQSALLPVAGHASTYTVGRKDQDVTIDGDKSISRAHCTLEVGADNTLYVTDPGSKFGTFVNGTKLEHHARTALAAGATLKVGETAFEVARVPLVFCASSCKGADKSALQGAAATLGAPVIGEWRADVTHLVMPTIAFIDTRCAVFFKVLLSQVTADARTGGDELVATPDVRVSFNR